MICFSRFELYFKALAGYCFHIKQTRGIISKFPVIFFWWIFFSFQLYLSINGLIFIIFLNVFQFLHELIHLFIFGICCCFFVFLSIKGLIFIIPFERFPVSTCLLLFIESNYQHIYWLNLLLLFYFLSNQENLYVIYHNLDLFYDNCNTIIQHDQR